MTQQNQPEPGVVVHALIALAAHIGEHQLPNPSEIRVDADSVVVYVQGRYARAWRKSVHADDVKRDRVPGAILEWVVLSGRLPASGTRIRLEFTRPVLRTAARSVSA